MYYLNIIKFYMRIFLMILMIIIILFNSSQPRRENFEFLRRAKQSYTNRIIDKKNKLRNMIVEMMI